MILDPTDQRVRDAGFNFVPFNRFLASPFQIPQDDTNTTDPSTGAGITTLPVGGSRDDVRGYESFTPEFTRRGVFADPKEYGPGGTYEINPAALGFEFGPQGQVMRAGPTDYMQRQLGPTTTNPRMFGSSLDRAMFRVAGIPAGEIADMYDARMQNIPGQDFRNFLKNFTGAQSNYASARAPGMIDTLLDKIPSVTGILRSLGGNRDRSDTARFAVDDAGYGTGTQRDQFGVFTGGKTLLGKTGSYAERMRNTISDIAKNFGYSEEDLMGLDPATLDSLAARNNLKKTQVIDYVNKLRAKDIEAEYAKELEKEFADKGMSDPNDPSRTGASGRRPGSGGTVDRVTSGPDRNVDDTGQAYDSGGREGFGYGLAEGGIVDMLEIYD